MNQIALDLEAGQAARASGITRTTVANLRWMATALDELRTWARTRETFTMEEFRSTCFQKMPPPGSPNAWGALALVAAERRIIVWTKEYVNAKSKRTHAHPVKVWRAA